MKKVCIVGYGAIGPIHARAVSRLDHTQLYAVCDPNAQRAAKAVQKYGIKSFSDFDEMSKAARWTPYTSAPRIIYIRTWP